MPEAIKPPAFTLSAVLQDRATPSPTLAINEQVQAMWARGEAVLHMGFGESRFPVHPRLQKALSENAHQKSYLAGQGLAKLRTEIARFYSRQWQRPVSAGQVIVGPGSKALIFAIQMAIDAELILPTPSWVSYAPQAELLNRPVRRIPAGPESGYALTIDALDRTVSQSDRSNKILLLTSPNNPTGEMFSPAFLEELADFSQQAGLVVVSDEIYGQVSHGHIPHVSPAQYYPEGTIVLGGLSKGLSLGGWRLGTAVLPDHEGARALMLALRNIAGEIWSTPSAPVQFAALQAYSDDQAIAAYVAECARIHAIRTQYFWRGLTDLGVPCPRPAGAFYLFPNFDRWRAPLARLGVATSDDLARYLLETEQIATLPGTAFGVRPEDLSLRLSTSYLDMEGDAEAQAILDAYRWDPDPERLIGQAHPQTQEALARFTRLIHRLNDLAGPAGEPESQP